MLYVERDGTIRLTRGDTARITVSIMNDLSGAAYEFCEADTLILTVKRSVRETEALIQKSISGGNVFHLAPKDTSGLTFGKYRYDVELRTAAGDVYTVIPPTIFEVMAEVTY